MGKKRRSQRRVSIRDVPPELADQVVLWAAAMVDDSGVVSEKTLRQALHELLVASPAASPSRSGERRWVIADPPASTDDVTRRDGAAGYASQVLEAEQGSPAEPERSVGPSAVRSQLVEMEEELGLMNPEVAKLVRPCVLRGATGVVAGYEVDGRPIEAAWPEQKIGILVDGSPPPSEWLTVRCPGATVAELAAMLGIDLSSDVETAAVANGHMTASSSIADGGDDSATEPGSRLAPEASCPSSANGPERAHAYLRSSGTGVGTSATERPKRRRTADKSTRSAHRTGAPRRRPGSRAGAASRMPERRGSIGADIELYRWQSEALRKWRRAGQRGVVEAVTGSGKTHLAVAAIRQALVDGGQVLIVVPTKELLDQWAGSGRNTVGPVGVLDELLGLRRGHEIGILGDGHKMATFETHDVIVGIVNTVRANPPIPQRGASSLLVIDECHRVGSESNRGSLIPQFSRRLGLSATVERSDGAHEAVLEFFGGNVIQGCDYKRAISDGVVSRYKVALVGANFSAEEMDEYQAFTQDMSLARDRLVQEHDAPTSDFAAFMKFVSNLQRFGTMREGIAAGRYLTAMTGRRRLLAESDAKLSCLERLAPSIEAADRAIVFTDTKGAARRSQAALTSLGIDGEVIDSSVPTRDRRRMLQDFRDGTARIILAPRVLDEGVDVPAADLAVVMAASSSRRQMIQRMGRVLRRGDGRGYARFALAFIEDTAEDPRNGCHEEFLSLVEEHATQTRRFGLNVSVDVITKFVSGSRAQTVQPPPETVLDRVPATAARSVELRLREVEAVRSRPEVEIRPKVAAKRTSRKRTVSDARRSKKFLPAAGCTIVTPSSVSVVDRAQAKGFRVTRTEVVRSRSGAVLREGKRNGIVVVDLPSMDCLDMEKVRGYVQRHFAKNQGKPVQAQSEFAGRGFIYTQAVTRIVWYGKSR